MKVRKCRFHAELGDAIAQGTFFKDELRDDADSAAEGEDRLVAFDLGVEVGCDVATLEPFIDVVACEPVGR